MADADPGTLVLIPAHDEAPRIASVVAAAAHHLPVLVVDDGSTDTTADIARSGGATVVRQDPNQGKGAALRTGFRWAMDHGFASVITLDADGQHDPEEIPGFVAARLRGADLVVGRRNFRQMPPVRRLANTLGGMAMSWALGRSIPDNQSGYRLVSDRLMRLLVDGTESGFEFEVEMLALAVREGVLIEWVPIRTIYAGEPSHIRPLDHLRGFIRATRTARRVVRGRPGSPGGHQLP